jgi:type IV secretory pathway TraG/TraD family ATPase VirD4
MSEHWGRADAAGTWPPVRPVSSMGALVLALATGAGVLMFRYESAWSPLERLYLPAYFRTGLAAELALHPRGVESLLGVRDRTGRLRLALDAEVEPAWVSDTKTWRLTEVGRRAGDQRLIWEDRPADASLHQWLRRWIYADESLVTILRPALWTTSVSAAIGLLIAIPKDLARGRSRRHGQRLKGPELVTTRQFNRRLRADGIGFAQVATVSRLSGRPSIVHVPRALESSHVLIMGDSGTGKSALIRQILGQLEDRGETAIVYDPALEYTPQFYSPTRGDVILNPLDARSPYWTPADELRQDVEALTLATSLFPDRHQDNPFFTDAPRRLFAHLLTFRPSPHELARWLCREEELDRRVTGTSYAAMVDRHAPAQRSGVLASLNMVADTLQLLPAEQETSHRWSASAWATSRQGWLFLTSTPETRPRLVPLTSLWLDTLVLRLMNQGRPASRPVWFILDELATLQRLPQLHTAITENRKSNNPVVLGFQGRSQLETRYGHDAEAMLSQPATKIFLRTSEPRAAKWIAETIGDIETERLQESRSKGRGRQQSYGLERHVEPLVMPSEIAGLANLHGYLKIQNLVTRLHVPYLQRPTIAPAFIERATSADRSVHKALASQSEASNVGGQTLGQAPKPPLEIAHGQDPFFR